MQIFWYIFGAAVLTANKLRYTLLGYTTPKPFRSDAVEQSIAYAYAVVSSWETALQDYCHSQTPFANTRVLELGPGSDIGVGTFLIDRGAQNYTAFDKNELLLTPQKDFIEALSKHLITQRAKDALLTFASNESSPLSYRADPTFRLNQLSEKAPFSLVVSQAAFEHFEDPQAVIKELSALSSSGTIFCAEIDLKAHTRYIRDKDPNNIYRFNDTLYRLLHYTGIPNRVRVEEYQQYFEENGWENITIIHKRNVAPAQSNTLKGLNKRFNKYDMQALEIILLATKK